ncbi:Hypothetical predicted protein [Olea europaea subsp. europaea]|uniref:Uncharacterized protein n=1 Tax=Olea europaea subsp. europaea TaxID=158383 RepID=A0A8S0Q5W7_OLEEU|nr:Hypothetical predicted protein [Olea europaea subsp. europaea]
MADRGGVVNGTRDGYGHPEFHPEPRILLLIMKLKKEDAHDSFQGDIDTPRCCEDGTGKCRLPIQCRREIFALG